MAVRGLGALAAGLALSLAAGAAGAGEVWGVGTYPGTPYQSFLGINASGRLNLFGTVGYDVGGGFFQPLTTPVTGIAAGNGALYAIGTQSGTPYTSIYTLNHDGHIQSTGEIGFNTGSGFTPWAKPFSAIAFGGGDTLYALGTDPGTPYTYIYKLDLTGRMEEYGAMGYDVGGGFFEPVTTPITGLAYENGELYAIGQQGTSPYTSLYAMNAAGLDKIDSVTTVGFSVGGGLAPYAQPLDGLAAGPGGELLAIGPNPGAAQTAFLDLGVNGRIDQSNLVTDFDGVTPWPDGVSAIAYDGAPEPAAWALMLLGFGGLGAALRTARARRRTALA